MDWLKGKPETGKYSQVPGLSLQPPEPGCQLPKAELPAPELPAPVPVTRHPKMYPQQTIRFPVSP